MKKKFFLNLPLLRGPHQDECVYNARFFRTFTPFSVSNHFRAIKQSLNEPHRPPEHTHDFIKY